MSATPILSLRGIGKAYGPVVAVREVDLDIFAGEVVA
ncbi:MAG: sugar ABC transporter ATP-binding protein, partial [Hyphomicrobiales bacterium]